MKVRLKVGISGSRDGQPWPAQGEVIDLPDDEAAAMCANGQAEPVGRAAKDVEKRPAADDNVEERATARDALVPNAPAKRGPGRPRKTSAADKK